MNVRNGFICKKPTNADYQQPLYLAAGAQPAPKRKPIAVTKGVYGGYQVIEPIDKATVLPVGMALYAEAPKRKPLTREEMDAATRDAADKLLDCIYEFGTASEAVGPAVRAIGRAVEAAHGIKENSND